MFNINMNTCFRRLSQTLSRDSVTSTFLLRENINSESSNACYKARSLPHITRDRFLNGTLLLCFIYMLFLPFSLALSPSQPTNLILLNSRMIYVFVSI